MKSTVSRPTGGWWSKLGKWQVMAVAMTLAVYFITLYFTGDEEIAAALTAFATFVVGVLVAVPATLAVLLVVADAVANVIEAKQYSISRKAIWFSCAGEFGLIFAPMLISILH